MTPGSQTLHDFSSEYSARSDVELFHLASSRGSLTTEAAAALDAELRRRNLTENERIEYQQFVRRQESRQARRRRWRLFVFKDQLTGRDLLRTFGTMALIAVIYFVLPSGYHLKPDWQDAAVCVMIASVLIVFATSVSWRDISFWMSLVISSAIHLVVVHTWRQRVSDFSRGDGKLASLLGIVLFIAVYGLVRLLQGNFYSEQAPDNA